MTIKEEFEKALVNKFPYQGQMGDEPHRLEVGRWAAIWFSEYMLHKSQGHFKTEIDYYRFADKVRQFTKELK